MTTTGRTLIYTAPSSGITSAVVYNGGVANLDTTNKLTYYVTIEIYRGGVYYERDIQLPVPFGSTLSTGLMSLLPGDIVYMTASTANVLAATLDIAQRS